MSISENPKGVHHPKAKQLAIISVIVTIVLGTAVVFFSPTSQGHTLGNIDGFNYSYSSRHGTSVGINQVYADGDVIIPEQFDGAPVNTIYMWAFQDSKYYLNHRTNTSVISVSIPDGVTKIYDGTFQGCSSLKQVEIPDSVVEIGWSAFARCTSLEYIFIPDSVTHLNYSVFDGCDSLAIISVPAGIEIDKVDKSGNPTSWLSAVEYR